jgi:hypothetical protein
MSKTPLVLFAVASGIGVAYNSVKAFKIREAYSLSQKMKNELETEFKKPYSTLTEADTGGTKNQLSVVKGAIASNELMHKNSVVNIGIFSSMLIGAIILLKTKSV